MEKSTFAGKLHAIAHVHVRFYHQKIYIYIFFHLQHLRKTLTLGAILLEEEDCPTPVAYWSVMQLL